MTATATAERAKYLFIHVPKTAGVKVRHNIHMNAGWPDARVCVQEEGEDLRFYTDAELREFDLISGHFGYAVRRRLEAGRRCVTLLRRPVDRVVSTYFYWRSLAGTTQAALAGRMSVYGFAASDDPLVVEHVDNAQAWQLFWDHGAAARRRFRDRPPGEVLDGARRNLRSLDFVGIQEDLPGCLMKMQRAFGWRWTDEPGQRINATPRYDAERVDLDRVRAALGRRIELDEALYAEAERIYGERA